MRNAAIVATVVIAVAIVLNVAVYIGLSALGIVVVNAIATTVGGTAVIPFSWKLAGLLGVAWWLLGILTAGVFGRVASS
jgi:hypothetical protein